MLPGAKRRTGNHVDIVPRGVGTVLRVDAALRCGAGQVVDGVAAARVHQRAVRRGERQQRSGGGDAEHRAARGAGASACVVCVAVLPVCVCLPLLCAPRVVLLVSAPLRLMMPAILGSPGGAGGRRLHVMHNGHSSGLQWRARATVWCQKGGVIC